MRLSFEEKSEVLRLYERNRLSRKYGLQSFAFGGLIMPLAINAPELLRDLRAPDAGKHVISFCFVGFLFGAAFAAVLVWTMLLSRWRRRENQMLDFMEKHFPEECPWLREDEIMREADELQRRARAHAISARSQMS